MEVGIKTYHYHPELAEFIGEADYIEVMALEKNDYVSIASLKIPFNIHAQHQIFGVNPADSRIFDKNLSSLNLAKNVADRLNASFIIVHPGQLKNAYCTRANSLAVLNHVYDSRMLIENMPSELYLCAHAEDMQDYCAEANLAICFDINHAVHLSDESHVDYFSIARKFMKLNPIYFHIGGQGKGKSHLSLAESELDLEKILSIYPESAKITLETRHDFPSIHRDIEILRNAWIKSH